MASLALALGLPLPAGAVAWVPSGGFDFLYAPNPAPGVARETAEEFSAGLAAQGERASVAAGYLHSDDTLLGTYHTPSLALSVRAAHDLRLRASASVSFDGAGDGWGRLKLGPRWTPDEETTIDLGYSHYDSSWGYLADGVYASLRYAFSRSFEAEVGDLPEVTSTDALQNLFWLMADFYFPRWVDLWGRIDLLSGPSSVAAVRGPAAMGRAASMGRGPGFGGGMGGGSAPSTESLLTLTVGITVSP